MCFNYQVSLFTFTIGTIFSIILFFYGNPKYKIENKISGVFFIFISCIQLMDFLFWIDIDNKYGINKWTTILGPILNVGQPTILYLLKMYLMPVISFSPFSLFVMWMNLLYFAYFVYFYISFIRCGKMTTSTEHGHLKWPWIQFSNPLFYLVVFALNLFYLFDFKYALTLFTITYFFLFISYKYFYYNAGELWCFFGSFIPLIMFVMSFFIDSIFPK
jgi:hypothetical protein